MNTKLLSPAALQTMDNYEHFRVGTATCNIPYFNNRRSGLRAALPALVGKGSPKEIYEELEILTVREKIALTDFTNTALKQYLVDHNIGIDCSGLAYFILDEESRSRGKGTLDRHLSFPYSKGLVSKVAAWLHPVKNADTRTFAHNKNSRAIALKDAEPGDIITMTMTESETTSASNSNGASSDERDHILVIHQIEYQNFVPTVLHYINSIAWPSDGMVGHGVRQGTIEITDISKPLIEQVWVEKGLVDTAHYTHMRAKASLTELRRLKHF